MPRLAGRVFAFTCAASLVLCLATAKLWVRSIWRADLIAAKTSHRIILRSEPGLLFLDVYRVDGHRTYWWYDTWPHAPGWSAWSRLDRRWWGRLGFGHHIGWADTGGRVNQFVVPYYFVVVATGVLPVVYLVRILRARRRARAGHCPHCGYDLRATPEEGGALLDRCPECGRASFTASGPADRGNPCD